MVIGGMVAVTGSWERSEILLLLAALSMGGTVVGIVLADLFQRRFDIFDTKYYFLAGFAIFYVLGMVQAVFMSETTFTWSWDTVTTAKAVGASASALLSFLVGYHLFWNRPKPALPATGSHALSRARLWLTAFLLTGAGEVLLLRYYQRFEYFIPVGLLPEISNVWMTFAELLLFSGVILLTYLAVSAYPVLRRLSLMVLIIPLGLLLTSQRSRIVPICLVLFSVLWLVLQRGRDARFNLQWSGAFLLVTLAAFFLMALPFLKELRVQQWYLDQETFEGTLHRFRTIEFNDSFALLPWVIELYSNQGIYLWGESYLALIVNPIPRLFWEEKPFFFGRRLQIEAFGGQWEPVGHTTSVVTAGELIANFGHLGNVIGHFVLGVLARFFYMHFLRTPSVGYRVLYLIGLIYLMASSRGDVSFWGLGYLTLVVGLVPSFHVARFAKGLSLRDSWGKRKSMSAV
jgi:hypothetical protein